MNGFDQWQADFRPIAMLDSDAQIALAIRAQRGDREARNALVVTNWRLVLDIAIPYARSYGIPVEDLAQEGMLGLLRAVEKFDVQRHNRFATYATWWIRQAITRQIPIEVNSITTPEAVFHTHRRKVRLTQQLQQTQEEVTIAALCQLGMNAAALSRARYYIPPPRSLNEIVPDFDGETELGDSIPAGPESDPANATEQNMLSETLISALTTLTPREREVLTLRLGLDTDENMTMEAVGNALGISRERTRQLECAALARLRAAYQKGPTHEPITSDASRPRPRREHPVGAGPARSH